MDAARILIAAGYDPEGRLEGWLLGSIAFVLRARHGTAALLTVDEARTLFAPEASVDPALVGGILLKAKPQ